MENMDTKIRETRNIRENTENVKLRKQNEI